MTFAVAMLKFFGKKEGQTFVDFANELKALTQVDKDWFATELTKVLGEEVIA